MGLGASCIFLEAPPLSKARGCSRCLAIGPDGALCPGARTWLGDPAPSRRAQSSQEALQVPASRGPGRGRARWAHSSPQGPSGPPDGELPPLRPQAGSRRGEGVLTSPKHQDANVGEHGSGHPVGDGRTAPGLLHRARSGGVGAGLSGGSGRGRPAGVLRRCKGPAPPRRSHALTLPTVVSRAAHS